MALTPSTGQRPQKQAKPKVATNPKSPNPRMFRSGPPILRDRSGLVGKEMDNHPWRQLCGPQLAVPGTGTVINAENWSIIEPSSRVIHGTSAAPSRTADWGTMASPTGSMVVDSDTPPLLGRLPEPQVRKNLFAAGPISPIVDQLDAENRRVAPSTPDAHSHLGPAREDVP